MTPEQALARVAALDAALASIALKVDKIANETRSLLPAQPVASVALGRLFLHPTGVMWAPKGRR